MSANRNLGRSGCWVLRRPRAPEAAGFGGSGWKRGPHSHPGRDLCNRVRLVSLDQTGVQGGPLDPRRAVFAPR